MEEKKKPMKNSNYSVTILLAGNKGNITTLYTNEEPVVEVNENGTETLVVKKNTNQIIYFNMNHVMSYRITRMSKENHNG